MNFGAALGRNGDDGKRTTTRAWSRRQHSSLCSSTVSVAMETDSVDVKGPGRLGVVDRFEDTTTLTPPSRAAGVARSFTFETAEMKALPLDPSKNGGGGGQPQRDNVEVGGRVMCVSIESPVRFVSFLGPFSRTSPHCTAVPHTVCRVPRRHVVGTI